MGKSGIVYVKRRYGFGNCMGKDFHYYEPITAMERTLGTVRVNLKVSTVKSLSIDAVSLIICWA
jgi:hypothetical protein